MVRVVTLLAAAALIASPALAQVSAEAPPAEPAAAETPAPPAAGEPAPEAPASEEQAAVDPSVYQVLRSGDRQMSCEQLAAEANTLNAGILQAQKQAAKAKKSGRFARGVAGGTAAGGVRVAGRMGLSRMAGSLGPFGALAAMAATDAVADQTGRSIAEGGQDAAQPQISPEQQRMNHLLGLYREKGC